MKATTCKNYIKIHRLVFFEDFSKKLKAAFFENFFWKLIPTVGKNISISVSFVALKSVIKFVFISYKLYVNFLCTFCISKTKKITPIFKSCGWQFTSDSKKYFFFSIYLIKKWSFWNIVTITSLFHGSVGVDDSRWM